MFVNGFITDHLSMKILFDKSAALQGAVAVATNKQILLALVQMSHHSGYMSSLHTQHRQLRRMEVDHSRRRQFKNIHRFNKVNRSTIWYIFR